MSRNKKPTNKAEAWLEKHDDLALARLVKERAHEPTIRIGLDERPEDERPEADEISGSGKLKVEDMRAEYRVDDQTDQSVGWVRPQAVTRREAVMEGCKTLPLKELGSWVGGGTPSKAIPNLLTGKPAPSLGFRRRT